MYVVSISMDNYSSSKDVLRKDETNWNRCIIFLVFTAAIVCMSIIKQPSTKIVDMEWDTNYPQGSNFL